MKDENEKELSGESSELTITPPGAVVKNSADVDGFIAKRQEFIQKVNAICVLGKDYHMIQNKKSLAKGGAEKIASIFQWNATFEKDDESLEMLGKLEGVVVFKCVLRKGTKYVGEGRGAASLKGNAADPNKTLKMAQKSAFIDAVLRASGLSDFFTQDLEDINPSDIGQTPVNNSQPAQTQFVAATAKQIDFIHSLQDQKNYTSQEIVAEMKLNFKTGDELSKDMASQIIEWLTKAPVKVKTPIEEGGLTPEEEARMAQTESVVHNG